MPATLSKLRFLNAFFAPRFPNETITTIVTTYLNHFCIGFSISGMFSLWKYLVRSLQIIRRKREKESMRDFFKWVKKTIYSAASMGQFLGSWYALFHVLVRIFHRRSRKRYGFSILFAAFLSGFISQLIHDGVGWKLSLYIFLRACFGLFRMYRDSFPQFIGTFPSYLSYVLVNIGLGYAFYYYPRFVDEQYGNFICNLADTTIRGVEASVQQGEYMPTDKEHCQYHQGFTSCKEAFMSRNWNCLIKITKLYSTVHIVTQVLSNLLGKGRIGLDFAKRVSVSIVRSVLFLYGQMVICGGTPCWHHNLQKKHSKLLMLLPWYIGPFTILFEQESRRSEITLFSFWRLLVAIVNYLRDVSIFDAEEDGLFKILFSSIFFGLATMISMYVKMSNPKGLKKLDSFILGYIFE